MKIFVAHSTRDQEFVANLSGALREVGHEVIDPLAAPVGSGWVSEVSASIRSADAVVAILTGVNPNVFYELGLAAGANVPTLLAALTGSAVPADVMAVPFVQIGGEVARDVQTIVRRVGELTRATPLSTATFDSAESALHAAAEQPAVLEAMSPVDFETLVMEFFKEQGYDVIAEALARDAGVDFALKSPSNGSTILVEVKKLSAQSLVSVDTVRRLKASVSVKGASFGVLVTTSGYTAAAVAMATDAPILLWTVKDLVHVVLSKTITIADILRERDRANGDAYLAQLVVAMTSGTENVSRDMVERVRRGGRLPEAVVAAARSDSSVKMRQFAVALLNLGEVTEAARVAVAIQNRAERRTVGVRALTLLSNGHREDLHELVLSVYSSVRNPQRRDLREAAENLGFDFGWPDLPDAP